MDRGAIMANYVRAEFCVDGAISKSYYRSFLEELDQLDCKYNVWRTGKVVGALETGRQLLETNEQTVEKVASNTFRQLAEWLVTSRYLSIGLDWLVDGKLYLANVTKIKYSNRVGISFAIDDTAFLGQLVEYTPKDNDVAYDKLKDIIICIVSKMAPLIGVIDEEADLLCDVLTQSVSLASWGNYFSNSLLTRWHQDDVEDLLRIVDEYTWINGSGLLTFIHPLAENQAWTARHKRMHILLERYPIR
jgi:hypothetical protein